jgi:high-affinity iron transporter
LGALILLSCAGGAAGSAAEVLGTVRVPDVCYPAISPAVVYLEPFDRKEKEAALRRGGSASSGTLQTAEVVVVDQQGLQFVPRVQAMALGQTLRFTNQDRETHNVHFVSPRFPLNQAMAPGQNLDYKPDHPGVIRLACDIHLNMRGFVVVSPTPWVQVCGRDGRFRLDGVQGGSYVLTVWHEMSEPVRKEITVMAGKSLELPALELSGPEGGAKTAVAKTSRPDSAPVRPWAEVLNRIGMLLAASRDAAARTGELAQARLLVDDAYWVEFEASDLETAVRKYLGFARAGALEGQFRGIRSALREVAEKRQQPSEFAELCGKLLTDLVAVTRELDAKGVTDSSHLDIAGGPPADLERSLQERILATGAPSDPTVLLHSLKRGFHRVEEEAARRGAETAASELTSVYMMDFEPLERYLFGRSPQAVRPLEIQFNTLRGDLRAGLKGEELAARLDGLNSEIENLVAGLEAKPSGTFGTAFLASLITILREGIEVILVLTMLVALVTKACASAADSATRMKERALRAIGWGAGLAGAASLATAIALNALVSGAQGGAREIIEGLVMLAAAGVLFYVSYWLVSHLEAKRWMEFLKHQARRGLELSGQGTLGLTAFLAVYREGAETALMYQALLGSEGRTQAGLLGLAVGLVLGLVLLGVIAVLLRATSVRLPMGPFFTLSGIFLFALSIIFAGNGVFELQNSGVVLTTSLPWMGRGLPWVGLHPNLQVLSVQALLLGGAVLAWLLLPRTSKVAPAASTSGTRRSVQHETATARSGAPERADAPSIGLPATPAVSVGALSKT